MLPFLLPHNRKYYTIATNFQPTGTGPMPVPLLPLALLTQHPDLFNFFNETAPDKLLSMAPAIKIEYTFTTTDDRTICLTTARLAIAYGKSEALKQLDLSDEDMEELFKVVLFSLSGERDTDEVVVVPECSHNVIRYLVSIEAIKTAFQGELSRLFNLFSPGNRPEKHMQDVLRDTSKSFELFTEVVFKSDVYHRLEWMYFIKIIRDSHDKVKIINYLHEHAAIYLPASYFGRILSWNDGSAAEVLGHYISPKETLTLDYSSKVELAPRSHSAQAGLRNLLLKSPSLALKAPVVLIFNKEQVSDIYDDLVAGSLSFPRGIQVKIDGHELVNVSPPAPTAKARGDHRELGASQKFFDSAGASSNTLHQGDNKPGCCLM